MRRDRRRDPEMREHERSEVDDSDGVALDADQQDWNLGVSTAQRAVATSARVVAAAQVLELGTRSCGDENLAGVWVPECCAQALLREWILDLVEEPLPLAPPNDQLVPFEVRSEVDGGLRTGKRRQLRRLQLAFAQAIDHPGAVRGRHDDAADAAQRRLQPGASLHARLPVVGAED